MPGYKELPATLTGEIAELTRKAAGIEVEGRLTEAVELYRQALDTSDAQDGTLPAYVCSRLAFLYRKLGRHQDEIALLERYAVLSKGHDTFRVGARLAKAKALADKARLPDDDFGVLASIRAIRPSSYGRRKPRRADEVRGAGQPGDAG